jgi:hypothetical protein
MIIRRGNQKEESVEVGASTPADPLSASTTFFFFEQREAPDSLQHAVQYPVKRDFVELKLYCSCHVHELSLNFEQLKIGPDFDRLIACCAQLCATPLISLFM